MCVFVKTPWSSGSWWEIQFLQFVWVAHLKELCFVSDLNHWVSHPVYRAGSTKPSIERRKIKTIDCMIRRPEVPKTCINNKMVGVTKVWWPTVSGTSKHGMFWFQNNLETQDAAETDLNLWTGTDKPIGDVAVTLSVFIYGCWLEKQNKQSAPLDWLPTRQWSCQLPHPAFTAAVVDVVVVLVLVGLGLVSHWMPYGSVHPALLTPGEEDLQGQASGGGAGGGGGGRGGNRRRAGEEAQFPAYHRPSSLWVAPVSSSLVEGRWRAALLHSILISRWDRVAKVQASARRDGRLGFFPLSWSRPRKLGTAGVDMCWPINSPWGGKPVPPVFLFYF